ncbi:MAG: hypothetical protein JWN99_2003 [Ilumatobacteraceae bacterium]|nr:hypothetical protein [Ilumatobacteraceae bacterium]
MLLVRVPTVMNPNQPAAAREVMAAMWRNEIDALKKETAQMVAALAAPRESQSSDTRD